MSSYRFCRTDDIGLLVDALNRCWAPHFPAEPPMTPEAFKRSIRDLQVWCSSCAIAFEGSVPIGVLIGAKRASGTLIHRIAVHPDHVRQGHGHHLLTSLSSKLAILGPPRLVAEIPEGFGPARALFTASGYVEEALLTDYVLEAPAVGPDAGPSSRFVIPITVDDLVANGLLEPDSLQTCWERSLETLMARKGEVEGIAVASDERIEATLLYVRLESPEAEVLSLRLVDDTGDNVRLLLSQLGARGVSALRFHKVHPSEISPPLLTSLGFRPYGTHRLYAARARSG